MGTAVPSGVILRRLILSKLRTAASALSGLPRALPSRMQNEPKSMMVRLHIAGRVWLSIGIFILGFVFFMLLQQRQGVDMEGRLGEASRELYPAALRSHAAEDNFQHAVTGFGKAVVEQEANDLVYGLDEAQHAVENLRLLSALAHLAPERAEKAAKIASSIAQFLADARGTYRAVLADPANISAALQARMRDLAFRSREIEASLQDLRDAAADDLQRQLATLQIHSARLRWLGLLVFCITLALATVLVNITIRRVIAEPLRRAEAELAHERESLHLLIATIPHAVCVYDAETLLFLLVNDAAVRHYGYTTEEFHRIEILKIHTPEEAIRLRAALASLDPAHPPSGLWKHQTKEGRILDVEVAASVFEFYGRKAVLAVSQDVTERKRLEAQLHQAQRLEAVGQLAAGIAHEINTPIQYVGDNMRFIQDAFAARQFVLANFGELLQAAEEGRVTPNLVAAVRRTVEESEMDFLAEEIPKAIAQSLDGTERVAVIVRAMKEFAHPGQQQKAIADLNKSLANALVVARNEIKYVADVQTDFGDLPPILCHIAELNQVFLNLLTNAADAIREVMKQDNQKGLIRVSTRPVDGCAVISISDSGCGIPENIQRRVFDPFFTTKDVGRGSGQGLAIARATVVEKHGGSIWFEPNLPRGTTFVVSLPMTSAPPSAVLEEEASLA